MELTRFDVDKLYSKCLSDLLREGYVALLKKDNDKEIVLVKDGVAICSVNSGTKT